MKGQNGNMLLSTLLTFFLCLLSVSAFSEAEGKRRKPDYLAFQTGLIADRFNSLGIRTFFEYQKEINGNWHYGIAYEHSTHLSSAILDHENELSTNLSLMSLNGYYKINLYRDRIFLTPGLGLGSVHVNWDNKNKHGLAVNASLTLSTRITKKVYLESLLVFLPVNRVYFSTMNTDRFQKFYAFSILPVGFKVRL